MNHPLQTPHTSRHNITARLSDNEYGQLANYAVRNGVMFDVAIQQIVKRGLIQVAIEEANAEKRKTKNV